MARETKHNDDFYAELDNAKHKDSCSCSSIIFFLIFLLLSGSYIVWWGVGQLRDRIETTPVPTSSALYSSALGKIQTFLQGKQTTPNNPKTTITLTDSELTSLLSGVSSASSNGKYVLSKPSVSISPDAMTIAGDLTKPMKTQLTVVGKPIIQGGELHFMTQEAHVGKLAVPQFMRAGVDELVDSLVSGQLNSNNITYEQVALSQGSLTLTGIKK